MGKKSSKQKNYFTANLQIRCHEALPDMIERGAMKHMMLSSEYVRQAVLKQLKLDGIGMPDEGAPLINVKLHAV